MLHVQEIVTRFGYCIIAGFGH